LHAARQLPAWLIFDVGQNMSGAPESLKNEKLVGHLLVLWMHQNTLVWGRVQLISAIQVAVIGGWYTLFVADKYRYAGLISLLGVVLSFLVAATIECDLEWRRDIKKRLIALEPDIFPEKVDALPGWQVITNVASGFLWLNAILFAVTFITKATYAGWIRVCG
jgi:hypothetical protein